jgi:hypothetical protein
LINKIEQEERDEYVMWNQSASNKRNYPKEAYKNASEFGPLNKSFHDRQSDAKQINSQYLKQESDYKNKMKSGRNRSNKMSK